MQIIVLGCGSSLGVPIAGCLCNVCTSSNEKNSRLRSSVAIIKEKDELLIDTTPDLRQQMLRYSLNNFKHVLYTHPHSDHCHGIDDLRATCIMHKHYIDAYSVSEVLDILEAKFSHSFIADGHKIGFINKMPVSLYTTSYIGPYSVEPYMQQHGATYSIGYKLGRIAYSTDVNHLPDQSMEILKGEVDIFIVGCIRYGDGGAHANLERCLEWREIIQPKLTVLTHMSHEIEYEDIKSQLPRGVMPAHDGMIIEYDEHERTITVLQ